MFGCDLFWQDEGEDGFANHIHPPRESSFRRCRQSREDDASASYDAEGGGGGRCGVGIAWRPTIPDELPTGLVFVCCDVAIKEPETHVQFVLRRIDRRCAIPEGAQR